MGKSQWGAVFPTISARWVGSLSWHELSSIVWMEEMTRRCQIWMLGGEIIKLSQKLDCTNIGKNKNWAASKTGQRFGSHPYKLSRRLSRLFRARSFGFRDGICFIIYHNIVRGCFRGKLPVNDVVHEYLHALLLSTCLRRCFRGSTLTLTHSFRRAFARGVEVLLSRGVPHMNLNSKSLHGGFWCCSIEKDLLPWRKWPMSSSTPW